MKNTHPFYICFTLVFTSADIIIFQNFLELYSTLSEKKKKKKKKKIVTKLHFFNGFTQTSLPTTPSAQQPKSAKHDTCFLLMLSYLNIKHSYILGSIDKNLLLFIMLSRFWVLVEGGRSSSESVKKGKNFDKNIFFR